MTNQYADGRVLSTSGQAGRRIGRQTARASRLNQEQWLIR